MTLTLNDLALLTTASNRPRWTLANTPTAVWYSAADTSTITAASNLATEWRDRKGNGINLAATAAQRPTLVSNVQNGRSILRFNGTSNLMLNASAAVMRNISGATLFSVCRRAANIAAGATAISVATSTPNTRAAMSIRQAGNVPEGMTAGGRRVVAETYQYVGDAGYTAAFAIYIAVFDYSAATLTLFQNGTQTGTRSFQSVGVTENNAGALYVGAAADGLINWFNGDIAETGIIHSAAGTTLRQQIEGYLGHEWALNGSLSAGHPFLTSPPYQ